MSGYTANVIAHRGVLEENLSFLAKPFSERQLLSLVQRVLSGNEASAADSDDASAPDDGLR